MVRMTSGAMTAPVARTTPKSATATPKNTNEGVTTWFRCEAMTRAPEPSGRNSANSGASSSSIASAMPPHRITL